MVSTSSRAGCPALSIAARISGIWLAHPVEVSFCTTVTALIWCPGSAASFSWTCAAWTPWRQSPGTRSTVQAELAGHPRPQGGEVPGVEGQHAVARRQRVDQRGLPGTGAGGGVDGDGPGAAAQPPEAGQHLARHSGELGTAVIDGGRRHRPQHPVRNIRGPGDLEEVPAALVRHDHVLSWSAEPSVSAELAEALRRVVGGDVRFDSYTRHLFSRDASMYSIEPIGVVFPRDSSDVAAVVSTAAEFGVPVLPRGAGTSLAGQTVGQAIVLDLSRHMSQIIEIDAERRVARVQPGVVQEQLNLAAGRHGLVFGPDSSSWAGLHRPGAAAGHDPDGAGQPAGAARPRRCGRRAAAGLVRARPACCGSR